MAVAGEHPRTAHVIERAMIPSRGGRLQFDLSEQPSLATLQSAASAGHPFTHNDGLNYDGNVLRISRRAAARFVDRAAPRNCWVWIQRRSLLRLARLGLNGANCFSQVVH